MSNHDVQASDDVQRMLRELFDGAAVKSVAVNSQPDAEPEMARFLHAVRVHPEERAFVVQLFIDSFSDEYYLRHAPTGLLQFCMHALRWSEIRAFILAKLAEDIQQRGPARSGVWNDM